MLGLCKVTIFLLSSSQTTTNRLNFQTRSTKPSMLFIYKTVRDQRPQAMNTLLKLLHPYFATNPHKKVHQISVPISTYMAQASRSTTLYAFRQGALSSNAAQKCTLQLRATRPKWDVFLLGMMEWGGRRGALAKSRSRPRNAGHQSIYRSRLEPRLKSKYMVCVCSRLEVVRLQWINNHLKLMIGYLRQAIYEYIYIVRMNTRGERNYDESDQDLCEA